MYLYAVIFPLIGKGSREVKMGRGQDKVMNEVKYSRNKAGDQVIITCVLGNWRTQEGENGRNSQERKRQYLLIS